MNPLDQIREGLEKRDFSTIAKGYTMMTGKTVEIGSVKEDTDDSYVSSLEKAEVIPEVKSAKKRGRPSKTKPSVPSGQTFTGKKMKILTVPEDKEYSKKLKKAANKVKEEKGSRRPSHNMMDCAKCDHSFNRTSFVVGTSFDDGKQETKVKCPKCKTEQTI